MSSALCKTTDLDALGSIGLEVKIKRKMQDIFIIKKGHAFFAYKNQCPHRLTQMEWNPNDFLTKDKQHIICAMHAAIFNLDDGLCISGPCIGKSLKKIDIFIKEGEIFSGRSIT